MAKQWLRRGKGQPHHDWSNSGSFISRPPNGWLHPDEQLSPNAGICYGVRVRSAVALFDFNHNISTVCHLRIVTKWLKLGSHDFYSVVQCFKVSFVKFELHKIIVKMLRGL